MNNTRPSSSLFVRLGLLALLASSVACAHGGSSLEPGRGTAFAVGPGGKGISSPNDFESGRSAPNFVDSAPRERAMTERAVLPPVIERR